MRPWLLLAPLLLVLAVLLVIPAGSMLADGFRQMDTATFALKDGYTLANFHRILFDGFYLGLLARTLRIAALVTLAALLFAYPAALYLSAAGPRERGVLMLLITAPLMVSLVIRSFGWIILLGPRGLVNTALLAAGLVDEPVRLMYNEAAVVAGMAQVYFPFMVLAIFAALQNVDANLRRAAANLGASQARQFWEVTLPLSMPGILAGSLIVFALSVSAFVTPSILGGPWVKMIGTVILQQTMVVLDFPFAAALSTVLLVVAGSVLAAYAWLMERPARRTA